VKHKARVVAQGCRQTKGVDFFKTFAPVVKYDSVRLILAIAAKRNLDLHAIDVKNAYLYGDLDEEIYMTQPRGFEIPRKEHLVCQLKQALYGLKQAGN
jgi:hypothetical protein